MEFRQLRYFVALAQELHFGRAASGLYITQQALSKQIRELEDKLGVKLLDRGHGFCKLTAAGEIFLVEAKRLLFEADEAIAKTRRAARGEIGQLKIAITDSALHGILPKIIKIFGDRYPDVEILMTEICTEEQVKALHADQFDLGFLHPPLRDDSLNLLPISQENFVVVLPVGHSLSSQKQIFFAALANESFILHPRGEGPILYDLIVNLCEQGGFTPKIVQEALTNQTRVSLVSAGVGITFVPHSVQSLMNANVVYKTLEESDLKLQLAAAWRFDNSSPVLRSFISVLKEFDLSLFKGS